MLREVGNIAGECLGNPRSTSVWSQKLNRWVCENSDEGRAALVEKLPPARARHSPINPTFKFIFRWSFFGTIFFVGLCVALTLIVGREPPPLFEKVILATFDLAQIGFGAIVGLLGGKYVENDSRGSISEDSGGATR